MTDSPFDVREREPLDGYFALLFLVTIPIGGRLFRWLGDYVGDLALEGELFGYVSFYALSIGFGIGALRLSGRSNRWAGGFTLLADILIFLFGFLSVHG